MSILMTTAHEKCNMTEQSTISKDQRTVVNVVVDVVVANRSSTTPTPTIVQGMMMMFFLWFLVLVSTPLGSIFPTTQGNHCGNHPWSFSDGASCIYVYMTIPKCNCNKHTSLSTPKRKKRLGFLSHNNKSNNERRRRRKRNGFFSCRPVFFGMSFSVG